MIKNVVMVLALFFMGCNKKSEPLINKEANLSSPIACMSLNEFEIDKSFSEKLHTLYTFDTHCDLKLSIKYKKDIVCNSPYNPNSKNTSQFPKSFLNMELRRGLKVMYSYYIDLYSNVDEEDVEDAFKRLKRDLIQRKEKNETDT